MSKNTSSSIERKDFQSISSSFSNSLRFNDGRINEILLIWKDLNKEIEIEEKKKKKQILFNVSGIAKPGEMIALMGLLYTLLFSLRFFFILFLLYN